jgi:hypothetical protein
MLKLYRIQRIELDYDPRLAVEILESYLRNDFT